jgi:hypothetical protein
VSNEVSALLTEVITEHTPTQWTDATESCFNTLSVLPRNPTNAQLSQVQQRAAYGKIKHLAGLLVGLKTNRGLAAGATNSFYFVITANKPITTTNPITKTVFNRVVLEGGKLAEATKDVVISSGTLKQ